MAETAPFLPKHMQVSAGAQPDTGAVSRVQAAQCVPIRTRRRYVATAT